MKILKKKTARETSYSYRYASYSTKDTRRLKRLKNFLRIVALKSGSKELFSENVVGWAYNVSQVNNISVS